MSDSPSVCPTNRQTIYFSDIPQVKSDEEFKSYCRSLGIELYKSKKADRDHFHGEKIDLTAFDLAWEDIRLERNYIVKQLRLLPMKGKVEIEDLMGLANSVYKIGRSCYFSASPSHQKSEDVIQLLVWFLNRRNLPLVFHIKVLQSMSMVLYHSDYFKSEVGLVLTHF